MLPVMSLVYLATIFVSQGGKEKHKQNRLVGSSSIAASSPFAQNNLGIDGISTLSHSLCRDKLWFKLQLPTPSRPPCLSRGFRFDSSSNVSQFHEIPGCKVKRQAGTAVIPLNVLLDAVLFCNTAVNTSTKFKDPRHTLLRRPYLEKICEWRHRKCSFNCT